MTPEERLGADVAAELRRPGPILVVGCELEGAIDPLRAAGFDVSLLDESETGVAELRARRLDVDGRLFVADPLDWRPPRRFDYVLAREDHVAPRDREGFREHAFAALLFPDGKLVLLGEGISVFTPPDRDR